MKISSSFIPCFTSEKCWLVIFGYFKSALHCCHLNTRRDNDVCSTRHVLPTAAVWQAFWVVNKTQAILMFPQDFWQWIRSVHLARNFICYPKGFYLVQNRRSCWTNKNRSIFINIVITIITWIVLQLICPYWKCQCTGHAIVTRYVHVCSCKWHLSDLRTFARKFSTR